MSYIASHIATIPTSGFKWYLIFLEGPFSDEIKKEIDSYFNELGREAGKDVLAVRGFDAKEFRDSVYEAAAFYDDKVKWYDRARFPALLVTNTLPQKALSSAENLEKGKVMIFSLGEIYQKQKSIAGLLTDILSALQQEDAIEALEGLDESKLQKRWGWLSKYIEIKPSFFGFSLNANKAITDLLSKKRK